MNLQNHSKSFLLGMSEIRYFSTAHFSAGAGGIEACTKSGQGGHQVVLSFYMGWQLAQLLPPSPLVAYSHMLMGEPCAVQPTQEGFFWTYFRKPSCFPGSSTKAAAFFPVSWIPCQNSCEAKCDAILTFYISKKGLKFFLSFWTWTERLGLLSSILTTE